jgi:hypothetical protein
MLTFTLLTSVHTEALVLLTQVQRAGVTAVARSTLLIKIPKVNTIEREGADRCRQSGEI